MDEKLVNALQGIEQTTKDLELLYYHFGDSIYTEDDLMNTLLGLKMLHEIRVQALEACIAKTT